MAGKVSLVSTQGDYGNHLKITNVDIMTLYAHCKTIYVSEGQEVKQGEIIAEVGNTGNTQTTFAF
jgi:murein DD-endopeptidase MepM/ murein hydrolase activator NlpD